jgi:glutamine cyclotransferase
MKNKLHLLLAAALLIISACGKKEQNTDSNLTLSPESGTSYKAGDTVLVKLTYPADSKPDSVVYLLDSVKVASTTDSSTVKIETANMPLGMKVITAKFYKGDKNQDASTNFVLMAAKAPEQYTYVVEKVFPHDTSAYTEGLLYQDGYLYESTGNSTYHKGESDLRKVDLNTGKVVQKVKLPDPSYFGEGSAIVGDKIVMFSYTEKIGFVFDKKTFKLLKTFNNNVGVEGWGVTYDGNKIYLDDSTNRIWFLDKNNYSSTGFIDVYDDKGRIDAVNELEYIDGKLY